jgi:MFS family permease
MAMPTRSLSVAIANRAGMVNIILLTNAFVWYYGIIKFLISTVSQIPTFYSIIIWCSHFAGITISALIGASWTYKIEKKNNFILIWLLLGVISSLISMIINTANFTSLLAISLLFGVSLGFGMPCLMDFYTKNTNVKNRGGQGGVIMLLTGLGVFLLAMVVNENNSLNLFAMALWRGIGLLIFLIAKPVETSIRQTNSIHSSYRSILNQRPFALYLIPWIMFCLVNYLSTPIQNNILGSATIELLAIYQNVIVGISAVTIGFIMDAVGRKRMAMIGFVLFGLGYSAVGVVSTGLIAWYFFAVTTGIAWGIIDVTFILTIWGDLSHKAASDKFYAIGMLPFFVSKLLELVIGSSIGNAIQPYALFSFTAFFLFLAVLPLFYAPETLPEKHIKERELKSYIEKAKKEAEKAQKKEAETPQKKTGMLR